MNSKIDLKTKIIKKLGISELNAMQIESSKQIRSKSEVIIASPTGSGKTLAFLLPLLEMLTSKKSGVQLLIVVPARELGIQIEQVIRQMGTGFKVNAVYGGRAISKDFAELSHTPSILVGTPGRLADHIRRETFDVDDINFLVLDEFDKSLEIGFDDDMEDILINLVHLKKKVLTSATINIDFPNFVDLKDPYYVNFNNENQKRVEVKTIISPEKDKLDTLIKALCHLGDHNGIIFCNFKDSIERISNHLSENNIAHGIFHGGLEQIERERALIKFRNGTHKILLATDLAARGIDIPEIKFILHYHLPHHKHEFIHRNGRTARMKSDGTAYVIKWQGEELPEFTDNPLIEELTNASLPSPSEWTTLFISGGRRDKISKGDIAGLFIKQAKVEPQDLGVIELKTECAFVSIRSNHIEATINRVNNTKLKKKKVRIYEI